MKTTLFAIVLIFFINTHTILSQPNDSINNDPRKFLEIYKVKIPDSELLWSWKKSPKPRVNSLDVKDLLRIDFDIAGLLGNQNIFGNISIGAKINDRKLEVSPYSEVGENQKIVVNSKKPEHIASTYRKIIEIAKTIKEKIQSVENISSGNQTIEQNFNSIKENLSSYIKLRENIDSNDSNEINSLNSQINIANEKLKDFKNNSNANKIIPEIEYFIKTKDASKISSIKDILNTINISNDSIINVFYSIKSVKQLLEDLAQLFDYFHDSGNQSENIFINISGSNKTIIERIKSRIKDVSNNLKFLDTLKKQYYKDNIDNILNNFNNLQNYIDQTASFPVDKNLISSIKNQIFSKLIYATIDLEKSGAKEGDNLYIYLYSYDNDAIVPENSKPVEIFIVKYYLTKLGWDLFKVSDSFMLIKSKYNSNDTADKFTPANYKPAPGVSLMFSYAGRDKNDFLNVLNPSLGINLTYVDFYQNKDVEVGAGFILGILNNKLFANIGWDLAATKGKSFYWGFGFSFTNLATSFSSSNSTTDSNNK